MVYSEFSQLRRYHHLDTGFLTTSQHMYDNPSLREVPNGGPHKKSTFGKLFAGSHFFTSKYIEPKGRSATVSTVQLSQNTGKTTLPSSTYRGNGNFTLELPHTSVTYRRTWSTKNTAMQSEYSSKFLGQRSVRGASTTPSVLTRKF